MARFDQVVLEPGMFEEEPDVAAADLPANSTTLAHAPLLGRLLAFLADLSLFAALGLALSPLVVERDTLETAWRDEWPALLALAAFLILVSYYYFVGAWLLWGKTVGGAIFDVKVVSSAREAMNVMSASRRWIGLYLSLLTGGVGALLALLPSRRSLADRLSDTACVVG
jgi:uncharacterized RDD family membrane protein YckC